MNEVADGDRTALARLLGGTETAWLLDRVRGRIRDAAGEPLTGVVALRQPTREQRAAIVSLVGRPRRPTQTLRVDLADVEAVLRRGPWPTGLADAVVTLTGPLTDPRAERERETAAWAAAYAGLAAAGQRFPGLLEWWEGWCARGGLKRSARAEAARTGTAPGASVGAELVAAVAAVLEALPASGEPLAVLARRVTGDAHGLDESRPLGRLTVAVVSEAFAAGPGKPAEPPAGSRELSAREVWAAAGVVMSNLASTVLCLGVGGATRDGEGAGSGRAQAVATVLEAARAARMPLVLTLDQVRSGGVGALPAVTTVFVCENPSVLEVVADCWSVSGGAVEGQRPVLVCTSGQPSAAVVELLLSLTAHGARCRYHGDFDWAGLRIAQALHDRVPWTPWRFTAGDYETVVERDGVRSRELEGKPSRSPWDPGLATSMARHGVAVEEEAVADVLAADVLAATGWGSARP